MFEYRGPGRAEPVVHAAPGCVREGCQLRQAQALLGVAGQMIEETRRSKMSQALWCDSGGHAFSERDPGRQRISVTVLDEDTEQEKVETRDFCGDCAAKAGLLGKRKTRPALPLQAGGVADSADPR